MHAAQCVLLRRLHDQTDRLIEALVLFFHLTQEVDAGVKVVLFHGEVDALLPRRLLALDAPLHLEGMTGDDVAHGVGLLLRLLKGAAGRGRSPALLGQLTVHALALRFKRCAALSQLGKARVYRAHVRAAVRRVGGRQRFLRAQSLDLAASLAGRAGKLLRLREEGAKLLLELRRLRGKLLDARVLRSDLRGQALRAARLVAQVVLHALDVRTVVLDARAQHRHGGVLLVALRVQLGALGAQALLLHVVRVCLFRKLLGGGVQLVQRGVRALQLLLGKSIVGVELDGIGLDLVQVFEPDGDLQRAQLVAEDQIFLRLLRLRAQRPDLQLQLGDLVVDAHEVLLRALELALRLLLAVAELGDARRLLEDLAAVGALDRQYLVDLALTDDGIALAAHAGIHEQLVHVTQAHALLVDVVFTLAAAVIPAGDGDLALLHSGEDVLGVVEHERHLREAHLAALFRAAEDDVLHLRAAQRFARLLAHDPADRVRHVGLAAAVGADDGGDILTEVQYGFIGKALKSLNFERF